MQIINALGFEDKDLPIHYHGSFGRFDKGRRAISRILADGRSITVEFFISFLDSVAQSDIKIDESEILHQAKEVTHELSKEKNLDELPDRLFFLYSKSRREFDLLS